MARAQPPSGGTTRVPWRVAAACLLIGLALSVASVPVAAVASQAWGPWRGPNAAIGWTEVLPDGGVYTLGERHRGERDFSHTPWSGLMRYRTSRQIPVGHPYERNFLEGPNAKRPLEADPRPRFLRREPPPGYSLVGGYSAGWPWHAAHSLEFSEPADPRVPWITRGQAPLMLSRSYVIPVLPIWSGLLGNTLLYGGALLLAWWLVRGRLKAKRRARGECLACGYPLDDGMARCPECGGPGRSTAAT